MTASHFDAAPTPQPATPLAERIHFCPHCGSDTFERYSELGFKCPVCDFRYYLSITTAVTAIVQNNEGQLLLIRRARQPGQGKWAFPGGFVDSDEGCEQALRRELREELNLEVGEMEYFASFPNIYEYHGSRYSVLDIFFLCHVTNAELALNAHEVEDVSFVRPEEIVAEELAFPSMIKVHTLYLQQKN